jgi:iron complex transport system ATP-binding protein
VIEVSGLTVAVEGADLLCDVGFSVPEGASLAVIGPNGAGKSTLLRCLDNLLPVAAGRIDLCGRSLSSYSRRELARVVSYVPQADARPIQFSVWSFVEMGRYPYLRGWEAPGAADAEAVRAALEMTGCRHLERRAVDSLSSGERQRVLIAAALAQGGEVLLLDEPTSFLDYRRQVQVMEVLERLRRERGSTIVLATHDLNGAVADADQVLALKNGRVAYDGPPDRLFTTEALREIYDAEFLLVPQVERPLPLVVPRRTAG